MQQEQRARPAATMSDTAATLSYAALDDASARLANALTAAGLSDADRVAVIMENNLEWFVVLWGVRRAAMLLVPVNWHLKPAEIRYVVENSDARCVMTSHALFDVAREATADLPGIMLRLGVDVSGYGFQDFARMLDGYAPQRPSVERDGGAMPYSSGTTGKPKGILRALSGKTFGTPNDLEAALRQAYSIDHRTVYLSPAPLYHSAPISFTSTVLVCGGTIIHMPAFDAEAALAAIAHHRVTHAQFVPTHFVRMLRLPAEVRASYDLSSLQVVIHAAAPCAPDVKRAMIDWLGPIVHEYYGGSERCGMTMIDSTDWLAHPGSVGRTRTGAIHILDMETGDELPADEVGTVYFENPVPFDYHKDAEKTAATRSPQGWGTHGDVGWVDADGYLYLADRRSDLILSGGVNIYPQEIENALVLHPAVADAAVIGVANAEFGQEVKAIVQLDPTAPPPSQDDLRAHCRAHLANFKVPRSIDVVDALPRLPSGKLLRRDLADRYRQKEPA